VDENADGGVVTSVATENATSVTVDDTRFEVADGNLKLAAGTMLDFESDTSPIEVTITASGDGASASHTVSVSINDVNEGPSLEAADGAVDENADGAMVAAVTASDPDADDTHTYEVSDDRFEVVDGMLKLKDGMTLDYETEDSVMVTITVTDSGGLTATADATVTVNDVNEDPSVTITGGAVVPVKEVTSSLTVAENAMGSAVPPLALIEIADPDDADEDMLTGALAVAATALSGDAADHFEVILDPLNGLWLALKADASLDYESTGGSVTVTVTYTDSAGNTDSADATVMITDANDDPVFTQAEYAFDLNENADGSATAVMVGSVAATDEDASDTHTFSITAGNDDGLFAIDSASGAITYVGTGEDYRSLATGPAHTLTVSVSDGTASAEAAVAVTIVNVNEAPVFGESAYAFDLAENQDGSTDAVAVGMVSATDPDEGDPITYSITSGNDAGLFAIDGYGNITYSGTGEDAESATTSYELMVNASDGGASSDAMVTVTVTDADDNAPMFVFDEGTTFYTFTLAENADGSETAVAVGSVSATDADGDAITYSIVDGNDDGLFAIDAESGAITYVGMGEDYESATKSHVLTVQASDADDGERASVTVNIEGVNEAPEADAEMAIGTFAFEGGEENRMEVDLKALFSDPDGDDLTFSLSDNAPDWLHFSTTIRGTGEEQTVTGTVYGTPPSEDASVTVAIVASDGNGAEGHASFDVVVDAENADPSSVDLRITDADGLVVRTDTVTIDENDMGAVIGKVTVTDADDARHPHGMHTFTFEVNGEASEDFEVNADGYLKLKDDASLNHEDAAEITLTVTATDMAVSEPEEGEDPTTGSASTDITINVKDVAAGDGPVANEIGDWWVTVDEDLDDDDVRDGDWLSFRLRMDGLDDNPAFSDEDGDDLTFSVAVVGSDGTSVDWLQIDDKGRLTNKEGMLPERGVYTVTVTATDEAENSASSSFTLAVAISDDGDRDNDRPDIRDVIEYDYTEGEGARKVAEFTIRDDDLEIDPHPYGQHEVVLSGTYANRFKLVELGDEDNDPQTAQYAIWTKSAAELAVDDEGKALKVAILPLDHETTEEVDITVTVTDGAGLLDDPETDSRDITIDVDDAPDTAPAFSQTSIDHDDVKVGRTTDKVTKLGTTTLTVDQEESDEIVVVVQLAEVWSDADSDVDDLEFTADTSGLPDWVSVYGPDDWEDIYERRLDGDDSAGPGVRDGDEVVVIVIDRTTGDDGDNVNSGKALVSFSLSAKDDDNNSTTETISIDVTNTNVAIDEDDDDPVVTINGTPSGLGHITMSFDNQDPDHAAGEDPVLELYTWSYLLEEDDATTTEVDESMVPTVLSVSTSPQPLLLDANRDRVNDHLGRKIIATVEYYEMDLETKTIVKSDAFMAETDDFIEAPEPGEAPPDDVSFDFTTNGEGLVVAVSVTSADAPTGDATAVLQASESGTGGWITSGRGTVTLTANAGGTGSDGSVNLAVDADADGDDGDGGGLYYRVVLTYGEGDEETSHTSGKIQLGQLADPTAGATTDIIGGVPTDDEPSSGDTLRVNTGGEDAEVQWQVSNTMGGYDDIDGATDLTLTVTDAHAGRMLRAKVTYMTQDDDTDTTVDESEFPTWVEYTEVLTVMGDIANNAPAATQASTEIRVELAARPAAPAMGDRDPQPGKVESGSVADLFFDPDDDDLSYSIMEAAPDLADDGAFPNDGTTGAGYDAEILTGGEVYRSYATVVDTGDPTMETGRTLQQTLAVDGDGNVTYFTNMEQGHDGDDTDGAGNTLTFTIQASDNARPTAGTATADVVVRVNVTPTAIQVQSVDDGTNIGDAGPLAVPTIVAGKHTMGTALMVEDGDDTDTDPDELTFMDDAENAAVKVADFNVMDQNFAGDADNDGDAFGTHELTLSGKGSDQFEIRETDDADNDGSTWELWLKDDATFNFEGLKGTTDTGSTTLYITVTAKDGGNLQTQGVFTVVVMDVADTEADMKAAEAKAEADAKKAEEAADKAEEEEKIKDEGPEVPGLKDDSDDGDNDGSVPPPPEDAMMGMGLDLLDEFVITIDDIDIA